MPGSTDILRLRVLLCFLQDGEIATVMGIAKTLGEEHYTISRILKQFEKEGLIYQNEPRKPKLTEHGRRKAEQYAERIRTSQNHLMYEGVGLESAKADALYWGLYNTEDTMKVIRSMEEIYRVKFELRGQTEFNGAVFCKTIRDGTYTFPFIIYREHVKNGNNISMANDAFEHPCVLTVKDGVGTVQLRAIQITAKSGMTGKLMPGKVQTLKYFDVGSFYGAEIGGDVLSFPAEVIHFRNIGAGVGQVLHGSVGLKMRCTVGVAHMPESTAIFTLLI